MSRSDDVVVGGAISTVEGGWLSGFRMVSGGVGCCRVGAGLVSGWCRVLSGLEVSGRCQGLSGLSVCEDACTLARAVGAVGRGVGLSGCRVSGAVGCGVGLSGLCRGEQPYFVVSGLHQGLTQTTTNKELRNRTQHAYLEIYAPQNFFKPKVFSSTPAF